MPTNKEIVSSFFDALATEGFSALPRFATDDVEWWNAALGVMSLEQLSGMLDKMGSLFEGPMTLTVSDIIAEGDAVAVEAESYAILKNSSIYNNRYHFKLSLRDGRIATVKEYHDTHHAHQVFSAAS